MANIFSNMLDTFGDWLGGRIAPFINDALGRGYSILGSYYQGNQRRPLKIKQGAQDDNILQNYTGLSVDRSTSRLFRNGVKFVLPEGAEAQQQYLDRIWDLNKKEILLYQVGLHGAVYGTPYIKICPGELVDPYSEDEYPKLIAIDPEIIRFKTDPEDMTEVEQYIIEYKYIEEKDGVKTEIAYREITRHADDESETEENDSWVIEEYEQRGSGQWTLNETTDWPYPFPPILHWKNLPSLKSCYGDSEIDDVINIQDHSNFVTSNTGKIIKFHAHPETIGTGFAVSDLKKIDSSVGAFHSIENENAKVYNLEMSSDLASSRAFALDLRQSIFDISREVDISSMADRLGSLTNFGLRVLYTDAIDKNDTKRQLYGDALLELNRRLLVLANFEGPASNPGKVVWGDAIIVNPLEEMQIDKLALEIGIVDPETINKRYISRYGVDWETVKANLSNQKAAANATNDNIGAVILRNFNRGGVENEPANANREKAA